jgi:undecaprenyl-diphosphatase
LDIIEAIILGIIQGITEFLPVSSSGHLEIGKWLLGQEHTGDSGLLMTVVLHFATALATLVVFKKDVGLLFSQLFSKGHSEGRTYAFKILISMIPAVIVGLFLEDQIQQLFTGQLLLVGFCLLLTGLLLFWADRQYTSARDLTNKTALWMGIAQAISILPGISRSGATIGAALLFKTDRIQAARFSFLMVVPLILGKMAKDIIEGDFAVQAQASLFALLSGFLAAFITGWFACKWMIALVQNARIRYFGYYCLAVGSIVVLIHSLW